MVAATGGGVDAVVLNIVHPMVHKSTYTSSSMGRMAAIKVVLMSWSGIN